jgi:amidase
LARARELDEYLEKTGTVVGALHGLPISLKDQISIKNIESTIGRRHQLLSRFVLTPALRLR